MRLIDADKIIYSWTTTPDGKEHDGVTLQSIIKQMPTIEPECKKSTIQKFHDYQVLWLLSHYDLELEPQLEEWFMRFLHDTANCYMTEIDAERNDGRR